jgi:hypothetical protein
MYILPIAAIGWIPLPADLPNKLREARKTHKFEIQIRNPGKPIVYFADDIRFEQAYVTFEPKVAFEPPPTGYWEPKHVVLFFPYQNVLKVVNWALNKGEAHVSAIG